MALTLAYHPIREIRFGAGMRLEGDALTIDKDELSRLVLKDSRICKVEFALVSPGESCRAGPVFDIVEPRAKAAGASPDWPGVLGPPSTAGFGTTHVLEGMAVTRSLSQ